jgi:uncharacterized YccA/Bax inhibitor family protein
MASSNPVFSKANIDRVRENVKSNGAMTVNGSLQKTSFLLAVLLAFGVVSWGITSSNPASGTGLIFGSMILAFVIGLVIIFKKPSPTLSTIYAALEGIVLGGISYIFNDQYQGIVLQAVMLTIAVTMAMLLLYKTGLIKVTEKLRSVILVATIGVLVFYVLSFIIGLFSPSVYASLTIGTSGVVVAGVIVLIAAFNLLLDFNFIDEGAKKELPKEFEWFAAFGLMVTLIWLYISILRMLFASRN